MSRQRSKNPKATASSMVISVLKKRGAYNSETAVDLSVFKHVNLSNVTLSYTLANLIREGVVVQEEDKYYYSEEGYRTLEHKFMRSYAGLIIFPILAMLVAAGILYLLK